jgi:hypothetical protein
MSDKWSKRDLKFSSLKRKISHITLFKKALKIKLLYLFFFFLSERQKAGDDDYDYDDDYVMMMMMIMIMIIAENKNIIKRDNV